MTILNGRVLKSGYEEGYFRCWRRTVGRRLPEALDHLSDIFLKAGLLVRLPAKLSIRENACQEAKNDEIELSDCEQAE